MRRWLLTILGLLLLRGLCVAQVKETVVRDFFANNSSGWPEDAERGNFSAIIRDGVYSLQYDRRTGSKCFDIPVKMMLSANFFFEMEGKIYTGDSQSGLGLVWGKGQHGYYSVAITADGRFFVRRVSDDDGAEYLLGPVRSKNVNRAGISNKIRVQYTTNNEWAFFVNNQYMGHLPSDNAFGSRAGVILYGMQKSEVYSFGAYGTSNYERMPDYLGSITIPNYMIRDDNGDCKVQPGENITLRVTLRNHGTGMCKGLKARLYSLSRYATVDDPSITYSIADLGHRGTDTLYFSFKVDEHCTVDKLSFNIDFMNDKKQLAETVPLTVPMYTYIKPIDYQPTLTSSFVIDLGHVNTSDINTFFPMGPHQDRSNTVALVIGLEQYMNFPKAIHATNDAKIFVKYLTNTCNFSNGNVIAVSNKNATSARMYDIMRPNGELAVMRVHRSVENVILYFSGLGVCEPGKNDPYILLYDSQLGDLQHTAYRLQDLVKSLRGYFPGDIICIFDASFSGYDRHGNSFLDRDGASWTSPVFPLVTDNKTCLIYASGSNDYNPLMPSTSHGMMTHFILTAMNVYGKNRNTLNMRSLFDFLSNGMYKEASNRNGLRVSPRIDCKNPTEIILIK